MHSRSDELPQAPWEKVELDTSLGVSGTNGSSDASRDLNPLQAFQLP